MRIISGVFKGKKILEPKDKKTRPLKDLTKESIFNIIRHSNKFKINFANSYVLDLFSGVGSFGIECLSRGVKKVTFVENIYNGNIFLKLNNKFHIIFLDPPYKDKNLENLLNEIKDRKVLDKNGIIVLHRHKNETDSLTTSFQIIEQRVYGISKIIFLSYLN